MERKKYKFKSKKKKIFIYHKNTEYKHLPLRLYISKICKIFTIFILFYVLFFYIKGFEFNPSNDKVIIESNEYKIFNEIKNKASDNDTVKILQEINIIKHLFSKNSKYYKKTKNLIHITFSVNNNNNYKYILLVSMFSVLKNCNKRKTFIIFHILCTPDFEENSIIIFKSLLNKFYQNTEIIFYNMGNHFMNRIDRRISQATYYRLIAPLFIDSERLIHLDGDTLTFSDLTEMYNLDFNDNYVLGIYDYFSDDIDYLGIKSEIYINAGVTLFNLKKLKEDKKVYAFLNLTNSNIKLGSPDQTVINYLLYPKIGRLKSKYAIFNFDDVADIQVYLNHLRTKIPIEEVEEALKNPTIIHNVICYPKLWFVNTRKQSGLSACSKGVNCSCKKYFNLWHNFANQTDYYNEIARFTGVK